MPPKKRTKKEKTEVVVEIKSSDTIYDPISREHIKVSDLKSKGEVNTTVISDTCNHQNKHYTAGDLFCVLPINHGGDHLGYVNDKPTAWSDAAGTPVRPHA